MVYYHAKLLRCDGLVSIDSEIETLTQKLITITDEDERFVINSQLQYLFYKRELVAGETDEQPL